ncbi:MAG TPA: glycosyltransferase [Bacteroidales bacterium]|nr:glycosyltransferase [Bacteroidales bacterium]
MKLLVVLPRVPYPLEKGDKLRAYHHLKHLSAHFEIVLCALADEDVHPDAIAKLEPFCKRIHIFRLTKPVIFLNLIKAIFSGIPFQAGYFYSRRIHRQIDEVIHQEKPDHVFCQLLRVAAYISHQPIPKTLDYQDVFSMGIKRRIPRVSWYLRPVFSLEYQRLKRYEHELFDLFDNKVIISAPDRELIPHPRHSEIHVIPNGVDHDFFHPIDKPKTYDLVFIGNMGYPPNVNAAEYLAYEILPLVQQEMPSARLLLAGATPDKRVQDLAGEQVTVTGWVDDIRDCYAQARIFVAPMQIGTGLQNKLLEAMSMRLPCITSPLANSALCAEDGNEILVAEKPAEYAKHILNLLKDRDYAGKIAAAGYDFVIKNYNWKNATDEMAKVMKGSRKEETHGGASGNANERRRTI